MTAALAHVGHRWTLSADLSDFFGSVQLHFVLDDKGHGRWAIRVRGEWMDIPHETVWRDKSPVNNVVPLAQGLPTSSLIADVAASGMDDDILAACDRAGDVTYTRYVDDLVFSADSREAIESIRSELAEIAAKHGFGINPRKWRLQDARYGRRQILGVSVGDSDIRAPRKTRRRLRAARHRLQQLEARKSFVDDEDKARKLSKKVRKQRRRVRGLSLWCAMRLPAAYEYEQIAKRPMSPAMYRVTGIDQVTRDKHSHRPEHIRSMVRQAILKFSPKAYMRALKKIRSEHPCLYEMDQLMTAYIASVSDKKLPTGAIISIDTWKLLTVSLETLVDRVRKYGESASSTWLAAVPDGVCPEIVKNLTRTQLQQSIATGLPPDWFRYIKYSSAKKLTTHYRRWQRKRLRAADRLVPEVPPYEANGCRTVLLRDGEADALYAGALVGCCQHPDGLAASCAWHAVANPQGAILATYRNGRMVAQSWIWTDAARQIIVVDSVEAVDRTSREEHLHAIRSMARNLSPLGWQTWQGDDKGEPRPKYWGTPRVSYLRDSKRVVQVM